MIRLTVNKHAKDPIYYAQLGYRVGSKTTSKTIKVIGKHSELLKITDDPLAYAKAEVKKLDDEYKNDRVSLNLNINFQEKVAATNQAVSESTSKNIGYFYLQYILGLLDLKEYCSTLMSTTKVQYNAFDIHRTIIYFSILHPKSKLGICMNKYKLYEQPEFNHQNMLRYMDVLAQDFDGYLTHLYNKSSKAVKRNTSVCYYDCTNYYFEIEREDDEYIDPVTGEVFPGFRKYGACKQHQPKPIVGMGLFMDADGIPLTMCLHPGSESEQNTAIPLEKKLVSMTKGKPFIYCADAGIGSYDIRKFNSCSKRAFIITQSIKKLSQKMQNAVFSDSGYRFLSSNEDSSIQFMLSFDRKIESNRKYYDDKIYKVIPADISVELNGFTETIQYKNGNTRTVKQKGIVEQYLIITFSRKQFEYQRTVRNRQIERARHLLESTQDPEEIKKSPHDIRRFIHKKSDQKESAAYEINEERIRNEEKYDGFYATATNLAVLDETGKVDLTELKNVLSIQGKRVQIEECFRVLKTNFDARPVNHRIRNRIIAHFMFCYTALLIYRLLEKKLDLLGTHFTISEVIETLNNMNVASAKDCFDMALYKNGKVLTALENMTNLELNHMYYKPNSLRKIVKKIY